MITKGNIREKLIKAGFEETENNRPEWWSCSKDEFFVLIAKDHNINVFKYKAQYYDVTNSEEIFVYDLNEFVTFLTNRGIVLDE